MMLPEGPEAKLAAKLLARPCPASLKSLFEAELGWQRVRRQAERVAVQCTFDISLTKRGMGVTQNQVSRGVSSGIIRTDMKQSALLDWWHGSWYLQP